MTNINCDNCDFKLEMNKLSDVFVPKKACNCFYPEFNAFSQLKHVFNVSRTEIVMSDLIQNIPVLYPSYILTDNGWIQQMDVNYDATRWEFQILNVHVIPFSHNDAGWLFSVESYYSGLTKNILDTAFAQLKADHRMTFTWAEVIFIQRWYFELSSQNKNHFKQLLESGRWEIVSGGWVMPDEAITNYDGVLNQLVEGHQWLLQHLNYTIKTAWSLDAFGNSPSVAHLLKLSGAKFLYIQRAHYAVKKHLSKIKSLEFMWNTIDDNKAENMILTHLSPYMLYNTMYSCGPNIRACCQFDFVHERCWKGGKYYSAESITTLNIAKKCDILTDQLLRKAEFFTHNQLLFLVGDDFTFSSSKDWQAQFANLTLLINYINDHPHYRIKIKYSTLSKYMKSITSASKFPILSGDFFPYSDRSNQYWSGFYTSRPHLKSLIRRFQSELRFLEIIFSLFLMDKGFQNSFKRYFNSIETLRHKLSTLQHHDTITGTSRKNVIHEVFLSTRISISLVKQAELEILSERTLTNYKTLLDYQSMPITKNNVINIYPSWLTVVNSLMKERIEVLEILVDSNLVAVLEEESGVHLLCQLNPVVNNKLALVDNVYKLYVLVKIKAFSQKVIQIFKSSINNNCPFAEIFLNGHFHFNSSIFQIAHIDSRNIYLENEALKLEFCHCSNLLKNIYNKNDGFELVSSLNFMVYSTGSINPLADKSGAYIFLPSGPAKEIDYSDSKSILIKGPLLSQVMTLVSAKILQSISLYNTKSIQNFGIFIDNNVNLGASDNMELALRIRTSINNLYFYSDLNSFQMSERFTQNRLPLQANFFPMSSEAFIEDMDVRLTVLATYGHAVASLSRGELEFILDRRLIQDDWRGLNEPINDNVQISSPFVLLPQTKNVYYNKTTVTSSELSLSFNSMLNHPVNVFLSENLPLPITSTILSPILSSCIHLVSLKCIGRDSLIGIKFLLILHYPVVDSSVGDVNICSLVYKIRIKDLFKVKYNFVIYESNLTGTIIGNVVTEFIFISQSEIKSWIVGLKHT